MAKVTLRTYNSQIEKMIDGGLVEEAIAHCRHILGTFPKHLETYRMLGKAHLEAKEHPQATDIFQRVLMSVPDDFVAHVGMSIIADDQKRLDDSIWHMERAFETQPSNAAIQGELQRLYGRRDGMEPPKIRLTRGALAHMYLQGDLYAQAIAEIHSVLAEDLDRTDMLDLLALAYFRNGQKADASDVCAKLIARNPFNLTANRILFEILPSARNAEIAQVYRQNVIELDPYSASVSGSLFLADGVADNSVSLERLEYKGQPVELQPGWSTGEGIALNADIPASSNPKSQPQWLKNADSERAPTAPLSNPFDAFRTAPAAGAASASDSTVKVNPFAEPVKPAEAIPDWMRSSGWEESTGVFDEASSSVNEQPAGSAELEKADLPDWIKSMAPSTPDPAAKMPAADSRQDDTMSWLNSLTAQQSSAPAETPSAAPSPKWLNDFSAGPAPQPAAAEPESLDWLGKLGRQSTAESAAPAADIPDWISSMPAQETETSVASEPPAPAAPLPLGDLGTSPAEQDAAMSWLESLAMKGGANADELITDPNARPSDTPEWIRQAGLGESTPSKETSPATPIASIGDLGTSPAEQDAAMSWLESLAVKGGANADELITDPSALSSDAPEWVEQARSIGESSPPVTTNQDADTFNFGDSTKDLTGTWLRNLDAQDALSAFSASVVGAEPAETEAVPEVNLPTWLNDTPEKDSTPAPLSANDELPGWLKGENDAVDSAPEPTRPADWSPVAPPEVAGRTPAAAKPAPRTSSRGSDAKPASRGGNGKSAPSPESEKGRGRRAGAVPSLVDPVLAQARDQLAHAKVPDALQSYGSLIRKGRLLDEVTFDLKDALYRFPVEVSIWQTLGDAYMRANRLQDALDAYTKAEELLR